MTGPALPTADLVEISAPNARPGEGSAPQFGHLAHVYAFLEYTAFGRELERARFCFLPHLRECRDILLIGEGDGRCLARLVEIAPNARLHCVDASPGMLQHAAARLRPADRERVTFTCADARAWRPTAQGYDAVVTAFFLDCLPPEKVAELVARLQPALRSGARWLFADFVLPKSRLARGRAQLWLWMMYFFFRWQTGLAVNKLPPSEQILQDAGWRAGARRDFHGVFVRAVLFNQPGCGS
jgi:cyclopropane fatty-acyl-phospholipid synthase-like methyltransferase